MIAEKIASLCVGVIAVTCGFLAAMLSNQSEPAMNIADWIIQSGGVAGLALIGVIVLWRYAKRLQERRDNEVSALRDRLIKNAEDEAKRAREDASYWRNQAHQKRG